jgi:replication factor C subunit 2/4
LLFYGPPGTGKTSTIIALARDMYGNIFKSRVLELNASDERGIDIVRTKIKNFAKTTVSTSSTAPPYKLIILDEADSMTSDAQSALRRTMETYSKITRFCLICNYLSRIIDPLASRCAKFRFGSLSKADMLSRLNMICVSESVECDKEALDAFVKLSGGDLRQAITLLQSAKRLNGSEPVTQETVWEMTGTIPLKLMNRIMSSWTSKDIEVIQRTLLQVFMNGYSGTQLLSQLHERIIDEETLTGIQKSRAFIELGKIEKTFGDGADQHLQMLKLFTTSLTI